MARQHVQEIRPSILPCRLCTRKGFAAGHEDAVLDIGLAASTPGGRVLLHYAVWSRLD